MNFKLRLAHNLKMHYLLYLYQKDERAVPRNLQNRKTFPALPRVKAVSLTALPLSTFLLFLSLSLCLRRQRTYCEEINVFSLFPKQLIINLPVQRSLIEHLVMV
jgi:hypothetical protein